MSRVLADLARSTAFDTLRAVTERDAYANLELPRLLRDRRLSGRDAALATELAYGTLRGLGTYDAVLAACLDRPPQQLDPPVLDALRLGIHQVLSTRIPAHAAVATTVELTRDRAGPGPAKLVNAVLRRVASRSLPEWVDQLAPSAITEPAERLALEHSHPAWVVRATGDALGNDTAELADALAANNQPPAVTLVARPGRCTVDELVAAGARPTSWSPYGAILPGGDPGMLASVRQGRAAVQDEGSQLVTLALAAVPLDGADRHWLDLCAGPGGKAALLAGLATERGAGVTAVERHPHRAGLVEQALAGDHGSHRVLVGDARDVVGAMPPFDRVLLDAPCSGLGALRRRPEARWRRQPADVAALRELQVDLLEAALTAARPGGVIAYVTCSPHLAETAAVVGDVLSRRGAERFDARVYLPDVPHLGDGPDVQLWPHRHGTDAMYLALLRRR